MVAPAAGMAEAPVKFGSELNPTVQPSNSLPGLACTARKPRHRLHDGPERSLRPPRRRRARAADRHDQAASALIAGGPGSFRLQIAKVKRSTLNGTNEAKVVYSGPRISYQGQTEAN